MKKIITLLFFISSLCLHAQKPDSIVITTKDTTIHVNILTKTVYKWLPATGVNTSTSNPVPPPPVSTGLFRGCYVGSFYSKITNTAKTNTLINWCQQNKITSVAPYGADGMLGDINKENALSDGINKLHSKGIKFGAIATDQTGYQRFHNYLENHTGIFDFTLREREVWNDLVASQPVTLVMDSMTAIVQKSIASIYGGDYTTYLGWQCQGKRFFNMVASTSSILFLHVYRANPLEIAYVQIRLNDMNDYCKANGLYKQVIIIISAELAFSQVWLKTHSFDEIDNYFATFVNSYSNIKYGGQMIFTDDFAMVSKPVSLPITSFAARLTNYSGNEFKNENILQHIIDSVDPNDK